MDPITGAAAGKLTGAAISKGLDIVRGPEIERVLAAVDEELGTGVGTAGLTFLRDDPAIAERIAAYLDDRDSWDEDLMISLIEAHVGEGERGESAQEFARRVVRAIDRTGYKAQKSDRDAIVAEVRRGRYDDRVRPTLVLSLEWVPESLRTPYATLAKVQPDEAAALQTELEGSQDTADAIRRLIASPPSWLRDGSVELWTVLGELAQLWGRFDDSRAATLYAAELPGADRARLFARASDLARASGELDAADELLEEARKIDPDHPFVRLVETSTIPDPADRLDRIEGVTTDSDRTNASLERARTMALLELGRDDEAREAAERARVLTPDAISVHELDTVIALVRAHRQPFDAANSVELLDAASKAEEINSELLGFGRFAEAARARSAAIECRAMAGDLFGALDLIESISPQELAAVEQDVEIARRLTGATLLARRPDLAKSRFLPHAGDTPFTQLLTAQIELAMPSYDPDQVAAMLDALVAARDPETADDAAIFRLALAIEHDSVAWSDDADELLAERDPLVSDLISAQRLLATGDTAGAKARLARHGADPRTSRELVVIAEGEEDWDTALRIQQSILNDAATGARRLRYAELLEKAGRGDTAEVELRAIAQDQLLSPDSRTEADQRLAEIYWTRGEYVELERVTRDWLELRPTSPTAAWSRVVALGVLGRFDEGLSVIEELRLAPRNEQDARIAATTFLRELPAADALARIIELSDRFERNLDFLEAMIIYAGTGISEDSLPDEINERRARTLSEFNERFPESQIIRRFAVPETPEGIAEFFREQLASDTRARREVFESVRRGGTTVAVLAAMAGKSLAETWSSLGFLPLAFNDPPVEAVERAAAVDAIGRGAVWDSSALFVAGGLGDPVETAIRNALTASRIAQSVLDDAVLGAGGLEAEGDGKVLLWDVESDKPAFVTVTAAERERARTAGVGMLAIARSLRPEPDTDPRHPDEFDEVFDHPDPREAAFRSWVATYVLARRFQMPIYSDDRVVRGHARGLGLHAFGTVSLLGVLAENRLITNTDRDEAIEALRRSGAVGLAPDVDQLIAEAQAANWELNSLVGHALFDPTAWSPPRAGFWKHTLLLYACGESSPDLWPLWVERVFIAATQALGISQVQAGAWLLAMSWIRGDYIFARAMWQRLWQLLPLRQRRCFDLAVVIFVGLLKEFEKEQQQIAIQCAVRSLPRDDQPALLDYLTSTFS